MEKAVFLDRDGTINKEVTYLYRPEDLIILPGVPQAIKSLRDHGFRVIVVTNQAGIARGYYTVEQMHTLHQYLNEQLKKTARGSTGFTTVPTIRNTGSESTNRRAAAENPALECSRWPSRSITLTRAIPT